MINSIAQKKITVHISLLLKIVKPFNEKNTQSEKNIRYKYHYIRSTITFYWWEYLTYKFSVRRLRCHCNSYAGLVVENARLGTDKSRWQPESWTGPQR